MAELDLSTGIISYVVFVYSTVCHEAAHAWTAKRLGDSTAYEGGQVSLDPTPHIRREPIGMVAVPILSFLLSGYSIGWAHIPVDRMWAIRNPQKHALVSMAGPLANLLLALLAAFLIIAGARAGVFEPRTHDIYSHDLITSSAGSTWAGCAFVLSMIFAMNVRLCILNMLPVPPLDGSSIPLFFLRGQTAENYQEMCWQPTMQLIGLMVAFNGFKFVAAPIFWPLVYHLYRWMGT